MLPFNENLASSPKSRKEITMQITGTLITLKPLQEAYFKDYHEMFSTTVRNALGLPSKSSIKNTITFLKEIITDPKHKKIFCIFDNETQKLIGSIVIRSKDHHNGQIGSWVNENFWGSGKFQEALTLVLQMHFKANDSISAFVKVINKRSLCAHQKAGFIIQEQFEKNGFDYYKIHLTRDLFWHKYKMQLISKEINQACAL
jgi:RimJ/RimL family protein N-acetyltransferase